MSKLTSRSPDSDFIAVLSQYEKSDIKELIEALNAGLDDEAEPISKAGNKSELLGRILDEVRKSYLLETMNSEGFDLDLDDLDSADDSDDASDAFSEDEDDDSEAILDEYHKPRIEADFKPNPEEAAKRLDDFQKRCVRELKESFVAHCDRRQYLHVATGGGKTLITIDFLHHHFLSKGKRVLWITHYPYLIYQAAKTLAQRHGADYDIVEDLAYFGSEGDKRRHLYREVLESYRERIWVNGTKPRLLFATWQALGNGTNLDSTTPEGRKLRDYSPDLVVIDEAHWGKGGKLEQKVYDRLFNRTWNRVPILGLSATPKVRRASYSRWEYAHVGNVSFSSLVGVRLAQPNEIPIRIDSKLELSFDRFNRLDTSSFRAVAAHKARNDAIVRAYQAEKYRLGKTLVVAASIPHANILKQCFEAHGEAAVAIHSRVSNPVLKLRDFVEGKYLIGIVVGMAREGVDIPDLKTVMLAKPITSEVEFAQVVGRASRRFYRDVKGNLKEKEYFNIVDFYDTLENPEHKRLLYHFKDYFRGVSDREELQGLDPSSSSAASRNITSIIERDIPQDARPSHEYSPEPIFQTLRYNASAHDIEYQALDHLRINTQQTFGIEFELAAKKGGPDPDNKGEWKSAAEELRVLLTKAFPHKGSVESQVVAETVDVKDIDHRKWNVVHDGSCGWEIVTPILKGERGFLSIVKFLSLLNSSGTLEKLGLEVNYSTGTHINLGWNFREPWIVQNLLRFMRAYEPALFTLVAPSRIIDAGKGPNTYCAPIMSRFTESEIEDLGTKRAISSVFRDYDERYHSVNLTKYSEPVQVLEVRLHSGTVEARKILLWVSLWMNLLPMIATRNLKLPRTGNSTKVRLPNPDESSDILHVLQNIARLTAPEEIPFLSMFDNRREMAFCNNNYWKDILRNHAEIVSYLRGKASSILLEK